MVILDSHIEGAQLFDPKVRGDIYRAIIEYGYFDVEPDWLKGEALGFFIAIKPTLDKSRERATAGRKGGQATKQTPSKGEANDQANRKQTTSKPSSKTEANAKQNGSKRQANAKQTASKTEANAKQTPSKIEKDVKQTRSEEKEEEKVFVSDETNNPIVPSDVAEIVEYLNERTGRSYKTNSEQTRKLVGARLAEGYTVEDCKRVIDNKASSWLNDPKMDAYLRPSTLFNKSKFEGYLNERPIRSPVGGGRFDEYAD